MLSSRLANRATTGLARQGARSRVVECRATAVDRFKSAAASVCAGAALLAAAAGPAAAAVDLNLRDGATCASPVHVEMAVKGLQVFPASEGLVPGTGHFHLVVDRAASEQLAEGEVIPFDATHLHYGKGQQVADIELPSGRHTLTLQFANALHESYGPDERKEITINVQ